MSEQITQVGDIELCHESFGDPSDPALLLIMGLGTQMIAWHEDFCRALADSGLHVIRFDNRDVGRSTHVRARPPTLRQLLLRDGRGAAYTLSDLAADAAGLLDALGIEKAHLVGASMGGMIAQLLTIEHPDRVLSLTSIMSTTGSRFNGQPAMKVYPFFLRRPPKTREQAMARIAKLFALVGSPGFERHESEIRELAGRSFDRAAGDASGTARQMHAVASSADRTRALGRIDVPTLVVHGTDDVLVRPSGGKATHQAIPGSRMLWIKGMGHDLPRGAWPQIVPAILANVARATPPAVQSAGRRAAD